MEKNDVSQSQQYSELIQAFVDALNNLSTSITAKTYAKQLENQLLANIKSMSNNHAVLATNDIPVTAADQLIKESLNAHISTAQSEQIELAVLENIQNTESQMRDKYLNKKISLQTIESEFNPFLAAYFDSQTGVRVSEYKAKKVKGKIQDLSIEKNLIIIKPTYFASKITPNRIAYYVNVVNPNTLVPAVEVLS